MNVSGAGSSHVVTGKRKKKGEKSDLVDLVVRRPFCFVTFIVGFCRKVATLIIRTMWGNSYFGQSSG